MILKCRPYKIFLFQNPGLPVTQNILRLYLAQGTGITGSMGPHMRKYLHLLGRGVRPTHPQPASGRGLMLKKTRRPQGSSRGALPEGGGAWLPALFGRRRSLLPRAFREKAEPTSHQDQSGCTCILRSEHPWSILGGGRSWQPGA